MSTVLEKPVLLDETGQAIVGKLNEIKDAIDNGGSEKYPVLIYVETMPTKTNYIAGEQLNLAGIVVKAVFSNNIEYDITSQCSFNPANGSVLASSDTTITASYTWHPTSTIFTSTFEINVIGISGIEVTTPPTKTNYIKGESLDLSGMTISLVYENGLKEDVTSECTFNPANGAVLNDTDITAINITYIYPNNQHVYNTTQSITVMLPVYGIEWLDNQQYAWHRTDAAAYFTDPVPSMSDGDGGWTEGSSPFDNLLPWSGIEIVEDNTMGTMVKIPKFYYKWTKNPDSDVLKLQISPLQLEGFSTSPAHANRGDGQGERDFVYVSRYHISNQYYKSITGNTPLTGTQSNLINQYIHNRLTTAFQFDIAMLYTIYMLYLVEYANWDSQACIGLGAGVDVITAQSSSITYVTGRTDSMTYHTGTTATDKTSVGEVQYRHIEGLWSGVLDFVDGIYANDGIYKIQNNPNNFGNFNSATQFGDAYTGLTNPGAFDIPSFPGYALYAKSGVGYFPDGWQMQKQSVAPYSPIVHGGYNSGATYLLTYGLFYMQEQQLGSVYKYNGARSMILPNNS